MALNARVYTTYFKCNDSFYAKVTQYLGVVNGKSKNRCINLTTYILDITDGRTNIVDHKNHDTLDNRRKNLRITTIKYNSQSRKSKNSNNQSGYRNVCWLKDENKWCVQLQINGKNTRLGKFDYDQLEEAGAFAEEMRKKYYGEFAGKG